MRGWWWWLLLSGGGGRWGNVGGSSSLLGGFTWGGNTYAIISMSSHNLDEQPGKATTSAPIKDKSRNNLVSNTS